MNGKALSLMAVFTALACGSAAARQAEGSSTDRAPVRVAPAGVQLAQAREVEIVIDERGRELIVDAYTREVLAVRRPSGRLDQTDRRREREYELGRNVREDEYGRPTRRETLGERLERDLDHMLGRREGPRDYEPDYAEPDPRYGLPRESFPPPPDQYDDYRMGRSDPAYPAPDFEASRDRRYEEPMQDRRSLPDPLQVERAPLQQPGTDSGSVATIPPSEELILNQPSPLSPDGRVAPLTPGRASEDVAKIQILLDRAGVSPGVVDGRMGDNVNKALSAYHDKKGVALRTYDKESIEAALSETGGPAFTEYTIQPTDAAGPYVASVPEDYGKKAQMDQLGYVSVTEMLAERFHMDENYLKALNPGVDFSKPGTILRVANVGQPLKGEVARITADKRNKQVRAYDASGALVAAYPATIGSGDTPSPSGNVTVERIAFDPEYTYNPNLNFKQGDNHQVLTIPPGPNGPVGSIWIALSKPTYGIHGTPEPSKIGKTYSHGCVRLTNWDAAELAKMVKKGVTVEFLE